MQPTETMRVRPKIGRPPASDAGRDPWAMSWDKIPGWSNRRMIAFGATAAAALGLFAAFLSAQNNEGAISQKAMNALAPASGSVAPPVPSDAGVAIQSESGTEKLSGTIVVVGSSDRSLAGAEPPKELSADDKKRLLEIISRH